MPPKVFIDANVFLDYFLKRANFDDCEKIMQLINDGKLLGYTSPAVLHILSDWLTKSFSSIKAKELLTLLLKEVTIIDSNHTIALSAIQSKINDVEDALQYYTSIHHKLDYFISLDGKLLKEKLTYLKIYSPKDFLLNVKI